LVSDLDLKNRVIFTGFVSYDQLPRYLALSKVAINPLEISRVASIAFPNKVLQYLASGLPVVSTRLQGLASALVGIKSLVWAESPSEVIDEALRIAHAKDFEKHSLDASAALKNLFSPSKALKAMEQTLYQAIDLNRRS
jgi:glycosyltransferase involved in cell wall biosynthesis